MKSYQGWKLICVRNTMVMDRLVLQPQMAVLAFKFYKKSDMVDSAFV